jgi:hypothetical protein
MIFVDTSAFLAIENRHDNHHTEALRFKDLCLKTGSKLITSDYVLDESYTIIRLKAGHHIAVQFGEALRASRLLHVEYLTPDMIEQAWTVFKKYKDHDFSFTDCTSFVLMERLKIRNAFTFDAHFKVYPGIISKP